MANKSWRENIDPIIKGHLDAQINESYRYRRFYKDAKNPANAQLWCAIANLSKEIVDLSLRIKFLEKTLQEIGGGKKKDTRPDKDVKKVLDALQKF